MHELSIVASLFEILEGAARGNDAQKILGVKLRVGKLSGVVPECLETAFEVYKKGTLAEEAILEIEETPLRIRCRSCGKASRIEDYAFCCPECSSREVSIIEGTELLLEKIDLEIR